MSTKSKDTMNAGRVSRELITELLSDNRKAITVVSKEHRQFQKEVTKKIDVVAGKVDHVERQFFRTGILHPEVIPVGLPVAAILIVLPFDAETEVHLGDLLDAAQGSAFKIGAHPDGRG